MTPHKENMRFLRRVAFALIVTPAALVGVCEGLAAFGAPIPGFSRAQAPLTKVNSSTVGIRASSSAQSGYMSAAQASDLAFVLQGGLPTPTPVVLDPLLLDKGRIYSVGQAAALKSDTFTRADTADISGSAVQTGGGTWVDAVATGAPWAVTSNQLLRGVGTINGSLLYTDVALHTDVSVSVTLAATPTGAGYWGVFVRGAGTSPYFGISCMRAFGEWAIADAYQGGQGTVYAHGGASGEPAAGSVVTETIIGNTITCYVNGVSVLAGSTAVHSTATNVGIFSNGSTNTTTRWTNFAASAPSVPGGIHLVGDSNNEDVYIGDGANSGAGGVEISSGVGFIGLDKAVVLSSSLSVAKVITSTVAGGTAPAVVASTTKVVNWNSDLLDGLDSSAFALAATPAYLTFISTRNVTNTSANASPLTLRAAIVPAGCTAEVQAVGTGAGTCTYALFDSTASSALCTVSLACNASSGATGTCSSSGTAGSGHTLVLQETAPAANTSSAFVVMTCSY